MARKFYYSKKHKSLMRSQGTEEANRDPRRTLTYGDANNERTVDDLLPPVGIFAKAGPSNTSRRPETLMRCLEGEEKVKGI